MDEDRGGGALQEAGGRGQGGGGHGVHHLHLVTEAEAWNGEDEGLVLVAVSIYCHCNFELLYCYYGLLSTHTRDYHLEMASYQAKHINIATLKR